MPVCNNNCEERRTWSKFYSAATRFPSTLQMIVTIFVLEPRTPRGACHGERSRSRFLFQFGIFGCTQNLSILVANVLAVNRPLLFQKFPLQSTHCQKVSYSDSRFIASYTCSPCLSRFRRAQWGCGTSSGRAFVTESVESAHSQY